MKIKVILSALVLTALSQTSFAETEYQDFDIEDFQCASYSREFGKPFFTWEIPEFERVIREAENECKNNGCTAYTYPRIEGNHIWGTSVRCVEYN